jgi:branched-chain amino acid transport system ATP-binding protein
MGGFAKKLKGKALSGRLDDMCELFPALKDRLDEYAGNLSGGQQQMLALARALVGKPDVLLLDEPSTGLAPILVSEVFSCIQRLKQSGMAIILAEQNVQKALNVADRAYVMQTGKIVLEDRADHLRQSQEIKKAYLGME